MSKEQINQILQRMQGIEYILGQLRIDQKKTIEDHNESYNSISNSFIELNTRINTINTKLEKDIIPYISSTEKLTTVITNIEKSLRDLNDKTINIQGNLNILFQRIPADSPFIQIKSLKEKLEEILKHFKEKPTDQETPNTDSIEQIRGEISEQTITISQMMYAVSQQIKDLLQQQGNLDKSTDKIKKLIQQSSDQSIQLDKIDSNYQELSKPLLALQKDLDYIKILIRTPNDQNEVKAQLREINKQIQLLNIDELNLQLEKLMKETFNQTDFSIKLVEAIKLEIRDRLKRIESNLALEKYKKSPQDTTKTTTTEFITQEMYFVYTDEKHPDKAHFIV